MLKEARTWIGNQWSIDYSERTEANRLKDIFGQRCKHNVKRARGCFYWMSDFYQLCKTTDTKDGEGEMIFFTLLFLFVSEKINKNI